MAAITVLFAMIYSEYGGIIFVTENDFSTFNWKKSRPVYYLIICNEILLPFPSRIYSSVSTLIIITLEIIVTLVWPIIDPHTCRNLIPHFEVSVQTANYILTDVLFYVFAALVAYYVSYLLEIVNRRTFLDHRRCVESKFKLNFEKDQQEQLLNSCLPKHLMERVRDDIRTRFTLHFDNQTDGSISRPFTDIYIEKHKYVTILYADIVNSMQLTTSLQTPKALVETLNGLFGRFDIKAEVQYILLDIIY